MSSVNVVANHSLALAYMNFVSVSVLLIFVVAYYSERLNLDKRRGDKVLENTFPQTIVGRLKRGECEIADSIDDATIVFSDIVGMEFSKNFLFHFSADSFLMIF